MHIDFIDLITKRIFVFKQIATEICNGLSNELFNCLLHVLESFQTLSNLIFDFVEEERKRKTMYS